MPQLKFRKTDVDKLLSTIKNDWVKNHAFQEDVVDNAFQRFQKRLMGWLTHSDAWTDEDEVKVSTAWTKFEDKHYACYRRWKKNSGIKDGGFDEKTIESQDFETRAKWLFLFYLVYGEIHEFRNTKNVFNVLYHCALNKFIANDEKEGKIADWLRGQGRELYKFLGLVYSNGDMIHMNFHHDDLDDLCVASHFIKKKFWHGNRDFKTAFKLDNVESTSFPGLAKMLTLDLNTFILYWLKSAQKEMDEQKREQREKWIKEVYFKEKADIVSDKEESLKKIREEGQVADKNMKDSESAFKGYSGRFKPAAEDFDDRPDMLHSYKMAWTQFETAKELLSTTEKLEGEANSKVADAKTNNFKNRKGATKSYDDATKKLKQAEQDYAEAKKGFDRAVEGFSAVEQCKAYELEARFLRDKAEFMRIRAMDKQVKVEISRKLQFEWEDSVNKERIKFAHKWKTYAETSGGFMGISGYMTIIYHYSYVSYMHCLMLFPMAWLYFDWHQYIELSDIGGSFQSLVDINGMWDVEKNIILCAGIAVALCLLLVLAFNICLRPRMRAVSAPSRDAGTKRHFDFTARFANFSMWIGVFILEGVLMKYLVLNPTRTATRDYLTNWEPFKSITLLSVMWLPVFVLYLSSLQFVFTFWVGVYGYFYGLRDKVCNCRSWDDIVTAFDRKLAGTKKDGSKSHPKLIDIFYETMIPENIEMDDQRKEVAFARIWNSIITYFYETHRISKEEHQRYSYKIKGADSADFLSGEIEKDPELTARPKVAEVEYHLIRFVNNVRMTVKPRKHIAAKEMLPLTVCTPVGAEKILYPYEFITHVDNTQSSFLQHLIDIAPNEWENFKKKECTTDKARDWVDRMEKDIIQGVQPDVQEGGKTKKKRWIHDTQEGQQTKLKVCEWGSMRFQALYRTVHGFMQIPKALEILARIEEPAMTQADAEKLARTKFSYVIGYQSFAQFDKLYKKTKPKAKEGLDLTKGEMEAHDAVFNIKYIKQKFPEVKIAYPDQEGGKYVGRMSSGLAKANFSNYYDYKIELFGPFVDMGLGIFPRDHFVYVVGKPTHQNYLSQFIDGLIIQTIDVNQDNVLSQCFFVPNALAEYDRNPYVKIVGLPEYIITQEWSTVAWCAAFAEHAFGTLSQRCYARHGVRLHYGHPDFHDALFVMTETGLSKMTYVSEDIFTGFDVVIKGGKIIHAEYCECGKARDVDLYTTTKFQRKISMGAGQMACSRYIHQLQTSKNIDLWQGLSLYYTTVGFYLNHLMLYVSVWFALVSQLFLIFAQKIVYGDEIATFITNRVFTLQIGLALIAPGVFQLILEHGVILALWEYVSHFLILSVYATFHILNTASYWQFGLTNSAFYLASGRGTGLEHYFMRDMYDNFYVTHWRSAFIIFWMGVLALAIGQDIWVFIIMYLLPSGIWLWGAMFLNPGSLPSSVHEEQWKRLVNRDMSETNDIIRSHTSLFDYHQPIKGNIVKKIFGYIGRLIGNFYKFIHWLYTLANFSIQVRFVRLFAVIIMGYQYVLANQMPTYIFTDERRRILRWDEEENRQKSIFYSTVVHNDAPGGSKLKKSGIPDVGPQSSQTQLTARDPGDVVAPADNRPLPAPPKKEKVTRKRSVRFLTKKSSSNVNSDVNGSSSSVNVAEVNSKSGGGSDEEESPLPLPPKSPTKGAKRAAKGRASPPPAYDEAQPAPPVKEGKKPTKRTGALPALGGETPSNNNVDIATPSEPLPAPPLQRRSQLPSNGGDALVPPTKRASSRRNEPLPQIKKD